MHALFQARILFFYEEKEITTICLDVKKPLKGEFMSKFLQSYIIFLRTYNRNNLHYEYAGECIERDSEKHTISFHIQLPRILKERTLKLLNLR